MAGAMIVTLGCVPRLWSRGPRLLDDVVARSELTFGPSTTVRVLSDGRMFVADQTASKIWLLDRDLRNARVVADTSEATNRLYTVPGTFVAPWIGDSTLFFDSGFAGGTIVDEEGRPARKVPIANGITTSGALSMDAIGSPITASGTTMMLVRKPTTRDTSYLVRTSVANFALRDTLAVVARQFFGRRTWLLEGDGVAMLPDGTVAVVRPAGYRIEWFGADDSTWTTPVAHRWTVLDASDKQDLAASGRLIADRTRAALTAAGIPDTVPPFSWTGVVAADADGHIWVEKIVARTKPYRPSPRGIFDVVDANGRVVRRVRLPDQAQVMAFAPGRIYYMLPDGRQRRLIAVSR